MIFEYLSTIFGSIKILIYKLFYSKRLKFKTVPLVNATFRIITKKNTKIYLGKNFRARNNVVIRNYDSGVIKIGNNCFFNDGCSINCQEDIEIGDNVIFGQNVLVFDHDHNYKNDIKTYKKSKVKIGNNVWIGANCVLLKGIEIGDNSVIGAGTVISKNISENSIVYQEKKTVERLVK